MKAKPATTKKFDKVFDDGDDVTAMLDMSRARRINQDQKRVNKVKPDENSQTDKRRSQATGLNE